jgi:hypothetical protein
MVSGTWEDLTFVEAIKNKNTTQKQMPVILTVMELFNWKALHSRSSLRY